jgi:hypothetical protein
MSNAQLRILIGLVLVVHTIGHGLAFFPALGIFSSDTWHSRSWLLTEPLGANVSQALYILMFVVAILGFLGVTLGYFGWLVPQTWVRPLAIICAVISLVALILYWNAFPSLFPTKVGAIAVNGVILWALLIADWSLETGLAP